MKNEVDEAEGGDESFRARAFGFLRLSGLVTRRSRSLL